MPDSATIRYSITDLALEFSITPRTIRFWEDQGLLSPVRAGGRRVYSRRDRTRLKLALRGKRLGLSLAEIKQLINLYDADRDDRAQLLTVLAVLDARRNALEQQREDIEVMLAEISAFEAICRQALDEEADVIAEAYQRAGVVQNAGR
jgi:DNA-binding transcriptional MerR regulator